MTVLLIIATLALGATPAADVAAVRGAEEGWSEAFVTGDGAFLERLLAPEYVSVGPTGEAHDKARIVDGARRFAAAHPNQHAKPLGPTSTIAVTGDMALVRHAGAGDVSVDVFQKRQDRWTAVFSQHTPVAGAEGVTGDVGLTLGEGGRPGVARRHPPLQHPGRSLIPRRDVLT